MNPSFPDLQLISNPGWTIAPGESLLVSKTVGYMLKVIKSGKDIVKFRKEFNSIKHGDYDSFFRLIGQPPPDLLVQGKIDNIGYTIKSDNFSQKSGDCDMAMIMYVDPCLKKFYPDCFAEYGHINDAEIEDVLFNKCAAFEITLRVHNNNERAARNIPYNKQQTFDLVDVINELCEYRNISRTENGLLQDGRRFLNKVKGHKQNFTSWKDGIKAFDLAWGICGKHYLKIGKI